MRRELLRAVAVGKTGPRSVRLWVRSPRPEPHTLELWREDRPGEVHRIRVERVGTPDTDYTFSFEYPGEVERSRALEPLTRYGFRITDPDQEFVGEGRFETAPGSPDQTPTRFAIGLASCHQPYDEDGTPRRLGVGMLRAALSAWEAHDVKFVLWMGDQMYADFPLGQSLYASDRFGRTAPKDASDVRDRSPEEVRKLYHARYRWAWAQPEWLRLQARFPGYPMLDDHDVVENGGRCRATAPPGGTRCGSARGPRIHTTSTRGSPRRGRRDTRARISTRSTTAASGCSSSICEPSAAAERNRGGSSVTRSSNGSRPGSARTNPRR